MRKDQKKKNAKRVLRPFRFNKKVWDLIVTLAELEFGGNITAWVTVRATTRNQEEYLKAREAWKNEREEILMRKLRRRGTTALKPTAVKRTPHRKTSARRPEATL